ncbi:MAG TPA: hypothetical protein PLV52_07325, partial [Candidatus Omnitrophota bacterium]|nr:hypothetical protein [Candidatus Omnitrophota bacterium]
GVHYIAFAWASPYNGWYQYYPPGGGSASWYNMDLGVHSVGISTNGYREASMADFHSPLGRTRTYKGTSTTQLLSETYYDTRYGKGDEISNYTYNYASDTGEKKDVVYYYYGMTENNSASAQRAMSAARGDMLTYTRTNRWNTTTNTEGTKKAETFYSIRVWDTMYEEWITRDKGDEVSDVTYEYNVAGSVIKSTTINFYDQVDRRAWLSAYGEALAMTRTYKGQGTVQLTSATYFDTRFGKDSEISDYSMTYGGTLSTPLAKTNFWYSKTEGAQGVRASAAATNDLMTRSTSHKWDTAGNKEGSLKTETYYDIKDDATGILREKGEEISDYAWGYSGTGPSKTSVTYYWYGTEEGGGSWRADSASSDDRMAMTKLFRWNSTGEGSAKSATYYDFMVNDGLSRDK